MTSMVKIPPYLPDIPEVRLDWATYLDQMELADQHTKIVIEDMENEANWEHRHHLDGRQRSLSDSR